MVLNPLVIYQITCQPQLTPAQHYAVHPHHRNQTPQKSQWTVPELVEFKVFVSGAEITPGGYANTEIFGLSIADGRPSVLGLSEAGESVVLAKYTRDQVEWHGYPYSHTRPKQSVPRSILECWRVTGLISKPIYSRILRKQTC